MTRYCSGCFGHLGLRRRLGDEELEPETDTCIHHPDKMALSADQIAEIIDPVFRAYHYLDQSGQKGDELAHAVAEFLETNEDIAESIADALVANEMGEDPFYDTTMHYEHHSFISSFEHTFHWYKIREGLMHRQRFFNPDAKRLLDSLFTNVHLLRDVGGASPVYRLPSEAYIFRARVAESHEQHKTFLADPRRELGPPPVRLRRAGRMNPAGIPAFYGALDTDTCIAELRPGRRRMVVICAFALLRPIWVMDLSFFSRPIMETDRFDIDHVPRRQQWQFMNEFVDDVSRPIFPEDEVFDYIPSQACAEYLCNFTFEIDQQRQKVEALIYPSAQSTHGRNIVFLGEAAGVANPEAEAMFQTSSAALLNYVEGSVKVFRVDFDYSAWEIERDPFA